MALGMKPRQHNAVAAHVTAALRIHQQGGSCSMQHMGVDGKLQPGYRMGCEQVRLFPAPAYSAQRFFQHTFQVSHGFFQQQPVCLRSGQMKEQACQRVVAEKIANGAQDHSLMMRHMAVNKAHGLFPADARRVKICSFKKP